VDYVLELFHAFGKLISGSKAAKERFGSALSFQAEHPFLG
jgi:hypothetical protein